MTTVSLASVFFWLAVVCCAVAQVAITRSALRTPRISDGDSPVLPHQHRVLEVAWTIIPAVGLAFVLLVTWHAIHQPQLPAFVPPAAEHGVTGLHHTVPVRSH